MKSVSSNRPKLGRHAILATFALAACVAMGQAFKPAPDAVAKRLKSAFDQRTKKSCAPLSPIQTELRFASEPSLGVPARLVFSVMTLEEGLAAEIQFDGEGLKFEGKVDAQGTLAKNRAYQFPMTVTITGRGLFEVHASAIAGVPDYRFGRRNTLYIDSRGSKILISEEPFVKEEQVTRGEATAGAEALGPPPRNLPTPPPLPFTDKTDPNGLPLDPPGQGGTTDASTTVTGYFRYRHDDGTLHGAYGTQVFFWDQDSFSADDLLTTDVCDGAGFFSGTFDNDSDGGLESGTADVYLTFRTYNGAINVHDSSGSGGWYTVGTPVIFNNISGGSHDAGSWYVDLGTAGTADNMERAFEVTDYMSTAWAHAYNMGHTTMHYTYIQWYAGSTDGTYYQTSDNRIRLVTADFMSPDVQMHEYGHSVMDSIYNDAYWPPGAGGSHSFTGHYTPGLAWSEGFATYFSCSAQGNEWLYNDRNPANLIVDFNCDANWDGNGSANGNSDNLSNSPNWGYDTESAVLSFLLDLDDARNDSTDLYDWTSLGENEIYDVMRNYSTGGHPCASVTDFYNGWFSRGWAYHPQLNGQMMVHGMKQGLDKSSLGLYTGVSVYSGTWYYGGYGRGSFDVKNYGSQNYALNRLYVWLLGPGGEDVGQFGSDNDNTPIAARTTRNIWMTSDQTGYNPSSPNFVYGTYTVRAGHYRSDNAWQLLEPAESGTATVVSKAVVEDTTAPESCTATDDGAATSSTTQLHVSAVAVENQSSIKSYWTRVGTSAGSGNVQDWVENVRNNQNTFDKTITGLTLTNGTTYYITVVARNIENRDTFGYTDGILVTNVINPTSYSFFRGTLVSGGLSDLLTSNDIRLVSRPSLTFSAAEAPIQLILNGTSLVPGASLTSLQFRHEGHASAANVNRKIDLYDWVAGAYVNVSNLTSSNGTDGITTVSAPSPIARFVQSGTNAVRARISWKATATVFSYPWYSRVDQAVWLVGYP
jgi:hypothetical protein